MNKVNCLESAQLIASMPEVTEASLRSRPGLISRLSRSAIGVSTDIDITDLTDEQRNNVLQITAGVRDALYAE